jgi:uroporphyrinogen-III decarboxylase
MKARKKILAMHADADTKQILPLIERAGFNVLECFATSPMVGTTLADARQILGERVILWGGVPSNILEAPYTEEQFEEYMDKLFCTIAPGKAFILGIADNAMPGSSLRRMRRITQMMHERGRYPLVSVDAA